MAFEVSMSGSVAQGGRVSGAFGPLRGRALAAAYAERLRALEAENAQLRHVIQQVEIAANSPDSAPRLRRSKRAAAAAI